ncbi:uncharacterized protein OCT59_028962 [Rhizophagus irregularis]|nr:hypothetical protein OCT59_028962 [Rhizophagus irregularis]
MKHVLNDHTNVQISKKLKYPEALQELYRLQPEFNGKLLRLLRTKQIPYWKNYNSTSIAEVTSLIKTLMTSNQKFFGIGIREIINGVGVTFFENEQKLEKDLIIKWQNDLISYELCVLGKGVKEINGITTGIAIKRTLSEINETIHYVSTAKICIGQKTKGFEQVIKLRGIHLVRNQKNSDNTHEPFAILKNHNQYNQTYRRIDCYLLVTKTDICENCQKLKDTLIKIKNRNQKNALPVKVVHASQEVLAKKIQLQRKKIANKNQIIHTLRDKLQQKIEDNEEKMSEELNQVAQKISNEVMENKIDISSFNPIFQELIRIQSEKVNGVRYHPMFMRWAISIYSRAGRTAYEVMKGIMRLPSISTIKNYINENQQHSGWQNKTAHLILEKMTVENIGSYGRIGFFSHDSFKIQKGLLWSQRDNCYIGYLDFEDEKEELQLFIMQCEKELQADDSSNSSVLEGYDRNLATQVHQVVWHSATCNFAYPIAYYGINTLTAHEINKMLFQLAANLECIGIHTCGSICDGAGENRNHIKSFDWWASSWSLGDIVEVNIGKNNYEQAKIITTNINRSKFTVRLLNPSSSSDLQVDRSSLRPLMPTKLNWEINDYCEFKSPKDNKWHVAIITNFDSATQAFIITILSTKEEWSVTIESQNVYVRPLYDAQVHWMNYKTINPITGTSWFFISDPTHVFKKLRNNLSKSHIGEGQGQKNIREIMIDGKEVSWRHVQGVYDYTAKNSTAKITKLTKRHVWLTSWSKMRVDLAEHTLSKDVENAMKVIDELKEISAGTRFVIRDKQKTSKINWISPQCQFDLLLSIQGFLGMVKEIFTLYPNSTVKPRRISQDMLEGLFGTIRQLGGDSSTQTLKGYGHALNKFQVTAKMTSEIKSFNYGESSHNGMEFDHLTRYDCRTKKLKDNNTHPTLLNHVTRLSNMFPFTRRIFESLLLDDLFMGKIETPALSFSNENEINQQNQKISFLQEEQKWKNDIKNIALKSIPKRKGNLWMTTWVSHLEISLNNYLCSGVWYLEFQKIISQNHSITQRLVAYFLVRKVIDETFRGNFHENRNVQEHADPTLTPRKIITLNQAESQKFSYIIGWVLFKLLKRDYAMNSHPKFRVMHTLLESLCEEKVEYTIETRSQTTNIIPGPEFTQFMYYLESLVIDLFKKHNELGPNILHYVKNSLLSNSSLNQMFITILKSSTDVELGDEECTASLREGLKTTHSNNSATENKTSSLMKKANLPTNPIYALEQLRVWAQLEKSEDSFAKIFSVSELLWIIWAFGSSTSYKRKQKLVPIIISNLKNSTPFTEEALKRRSIFMEQIE